MTTKTPARPKGRNPLHYIPDSVIDARAALVALRERSRAIPAALAVAAANDDAKGFSALQFEQAGLPAKLRTAEDALFNAELAWAEARVEAAIHARDEALATLETAQERSKEVHAALDAERDESGNLPLARLEAIYAEFAFDSKAARLAREQWTLADAIVDREKQSLTAKRAEQARREYHYGR